MVSDRPKKKRKAAQRERREREGHNSSECDLGCAMWIVAGVQSCVLCYGRLSEGAARRRVRLLRYYITILWVGLKKRLRAKCYSFKYE